MPAGLVDVVLRAVDVVRWTAHLLLLEKQFSGWTEARAVPSRVWVHVMCTRARIASSPCTAFQ